MTKKAKASAKAPSSSRAAAKRKNHSAGARVFITGINGFIGSALAEHLSGLGYHVSGLVRQSSRRSDAMARLRPIADIYEGSLTDFYGLRRILELATPDIIIHLGAITPVSYSFDHPQEVTKVNYLGTVNLAEAARDVCPNLDLFVFSSSMEVYGIQAERPFREHMEVHPNCPYAVAKHAAEHYLEYLWNTYRFPSISLRQTNCYGRKDNDYFVVEAFITQMLDRKEVNFGRKEPVRNFIHIDDLTGLYQAIIEKAPTLTKKHLGQVYNTGPTNGITIETLADIIKQELKWKGRINWNTREIRAGEIFYLNSNCDKAKAAFDWQPKIALRDGIRSSIAYWKKMYGKK